MFEKVLDKVKKTNPLVHCITNYVTVNDVANMVLACGASPIMADDRNEASDISSICSALAINIGTLNERTIESMFIAGKKSNELSHPVVLDPVGAGASEFRTLTTFRLLEEVKFSVIRGNVSEIKTVSQGSGTTKGVDADVKDRVTEENLEGAIHFAKELSLRTGSVIAITGAIDIVADDKKAYIIRNGSAMMSKITGTGCMLTGITAAYCGANSMDILDAAAAAVCVMGLSGERAFEKVKSLGGGTSTFRTALIDEMSKMDYDILKGGAKLEIR